MDNSYRPPDGDNQDLTRTQEIGPAGQAWGQAPGSPGPSQAPPGRRPGPAIPPQRRRRGLWWGAGLAIVALLVGGSAFAVTELASNSSAPPAGPSGQAAQLNTILNSASSPASASAASTFAENSAGTPSAAATPRPCQTRAAKLQAAGHPLAAARARLLCRGPLTRLRLIGGMHGEFTFKTKTGTTTLAYERGVIQSVAGSDVVVRASDGTTWTWVLQSSTVVRQGGKKTTSGGLADGGHVFAGGTVASGAYQARLIVVQPSSPGSSPTPSPSASPASPSS